MAESFVAKRFGVIDDDQQRAMSGLEFVQGLVNGTLPLNTMAETLGYDIVEVSRGRVVAAAEPHAGHRNPFGTVHGGLAATRRLSHTPSAGVCSIESAAQNARFLRDDLSHLLEHRFHVRKAKLPPVRSL